MSRKFYYKIRVRNLKQIRENDSFPCVKINISLEEDWPEIIADLDKYGLDLDVLRLFQFNHDMPSDNSWNQMNSGVSAVSDEEICQPQA